MRKDVVRESLSDFQNVEHRLEHVANVNGSRVHQRFQGDQCELHVVCPGEHGQACGLGGGWRGQGQRLRLLMELVKHKVKAIVCLGTDNEKMHKAFGHVVPRMVDTRSAEQAVHAAYALPNPVMWCC
jgi:UDP-N-acetylmuramoylalanine--D-glutamate ligase